jgi:hypothetical protein
MTKLYTLIGRDGRPYQSLTKGTLGGRMRGKKKVYGRLDCPTALSWIKRGHYVRYRVFFANEETAMPPASALAAPA